LGTKIDLHVMVSLEPTSDCDYIEVATLSTTRA
jgi:hypothetical protein